MSLRGPSLIFGRLFQPLDLEGILQAYLVCHNHSFPVKEAIFTLLLNRILTQYGLLRGNHPEVSRVVIGISTTGEVIPLACKIFPGSAYDSRTLKVILGDLYQRSRIRRIIFAADRRMASRETLSFTENSNLAVRLIPDGSN